MKYVFSVIVCLFSLTHAMEKECEANKHLEESKRLCNKFSLLDTPQTEQQETLLKIAAAFVSCIRFDEKTTPQWILLHQLFGEGAKCITTIIELETAMQKPLYNFTESKLTSLPTEIKNVPHLTQLCLVKNKLKTLPDEMAHLTQLQVLDISENRLGTIPTCVFKLPQLTHLTANNIGLDDVPGEIGTLTSLQKLSVSKNTLSALPVILSQLTRLELLDCSDNEIALPIPSCITGMPTLKQINIKHNPIARDIDTTRITSLVSLLLTIKTP